MSLILPNQQDNPVLEKNLQALFHRYPHERARLEPLLRQSVEPFTLTDIDLPVAPSKPPIRILLLLGIANPMFLATILNDQSVRRETFKLFIFENDINFLASIFQFSDLSQIIMAQKSGSFLTEWFLCENTESVKAGLFRALKPEAVTSMMLNVQSLKVHQSASEEADSFYSIIPQIYDETVKHVFHNYGNIDDSILGFDVTLRNKDFVLNAPGVSDLKNYYEGCAALIIGAGPSLDQNLEKIKKYNDRFVVIAADAALKPLINAGIRVDYITSIERLNAYQKPFFEGLPADLKTELVAFPVVHPEVLKAYPGTVRLVYRNYSFFAYFEKAYPKGILRCGGSTSHLALRLAAYMGCRKAFMVGLDSSYEEKDGLYRSHCSGTGHPDWGSFQPLEDFNTKRKHMPPMKAYNNLGQLVTTNLTYYQWIKELSEELAYIGRTVQLKNCSANGLAIEGVPYIDLEKAGESCDFLTIPKPEPKVSNITRNWDHSDLLANFKAWLQVSEAGIKEANELLKMIEIDKERFDALLYVFNFRQVVDDLFVAFIIQCCAYEFFELENQWWGLSLDFLTDLPEKVGVLKKRFELFSMVITKLINVVEGNS